MPKGEWTLRELRPDDRPEVARILESSGAFRPDEVAVGLELVDETLNPGPSTDYRWSVAEFDGEVVGFACFGPVPMTQGTFDLYWIAVDTEAQGSGVASRIEQAVVDEVVSLGGRWLVAETSSTPPYAPAHAFYGRRGYRLLGRIEDYYRAGDDRLIYGKRLDQQ
ncbi:N-acetyltransferase family protein [Tundrisphaera lichenicola]|uniref:GNAT family N-acetyltransferase n=1 Tax=Tundrisphaera lichenicola TaxID=2029860 RepID=UPI003EBA6005